MQSLGTSGMNRALRGAPPAGASFHSTLNLVLCCLVGASLQSGIAVSPVMHLAPSPPRLGLCLKAPTFYPALLSLPNPVSVISLT